MYVVTLINDNIKTEIHGVDEKLFSGKIVKGINSIDSLTFKLLPSNAGINLIHDFQTLVTAYNTTKKRYEFFGRVLYSTADMAESGLITKEVVCESNFGYLCDSQQPYVVEKNWTVRELFEHIINEHNSQVEEYKQFVIGEITVTDPNDNVYIGIQRQNTWKTIEEKLIKKLGGEIQLRVVDGVNYIDFLTQVGETKATTIELSKNMKSITRDNDPSAYITRLIPLGAKLSEDSEERLDITSVNDGKNYIEDPVAVEKYGLHVAYVEFDDITTATALLSAGTEYLVENNKVKTNYKVNALDLSLLGLDIDDFDVGNRHPIINPLLGIDDKVRIIKKSIDICEEIKSTIELGDKFKTLAEVQNEKIVTLEQDVGSISREDGKDGEDATTLRIDSSRGTVFKNSEVSTVLSAVIYKGAKRITDITALREEFGSSAYLQWSWQKMNEDAFGLILSNDSRLSNDGFLFTISPNDVDTKVVFMCQLIIE